MKIFWKIFFTVMIISIGCFSIGSYILINGNFQYSLNREIDTTYMENRILNTVLTQELKDVSEIYMEITDEAADKDITQSQWLAQIAPDVNLNKYEGDIKFRILTSEGGVVYENMDKDIGARSFNYLEGNQQAYEIIKSGGTYFIHSAMPMNTGNEIFYIEAFRNITPVFASERSQYRSFIYIILIIIIVGGILSFFVSWLIVKPLGKLSRAAGEIAMGNYHQRVFVNTGDETGNLAESFNMMAGNLELKVKELQDANERQETFIGSFAHEIKTPLTSMIGYADMLRSRTMSQEDIMVSANYIFEEGRRMEAISMKLLELIILKKEKLSMHRVFFKDFAEEIEGIVYPGLKQHNIVFKSHVDESIINIEPDFFKTVLLNIIDNGVKAMGDKELNEDNTIILTGKSDGEDYQISISDNGKGMESKELTRITEAFYMVDKSRARSQGGAGLGLALCLEIIKLHNGELSFDSKLGKGTTVTITLKGAVVDEE